MATPTAFPTHKALASASTSSPGEEIQTSWTAAHPGRRFYICGRNRCRYWEWGDPQMCERSKQIIPGLLRKINMMEDAKKSRLEKLTKNPWFWVSCLLFVIVLWLMYGKGKDNEGYLPEKPM
ncbi:unnamed protein product [Prunus armeniaca]